MTGGSFTQVAMHADKVTQDNGQILSSSVFPLKPSLSLGIKLIPTTTTKPSPAALPQTHPKEPKGGRLPLQSFSRLLSTPA